jgi:hypothetical protein
VNAEAGGVAGVVVADVAMDAAMGVTGLQSRAWQRQRWKVRRL